jgi:hypothetical protein
MWLLTVVGPECLGVAITDRFGEMSAEQVADTARTAAEIGMLLRDRLVAGERDRALRRELVEHLLSGDAAGATFTLRL